MSPFTPLTDLTTVATGLSRRQAEDVIVILAAMGIPAVSDRSDDATWHVDVAATDAERATELIAEEYPRGFAFPSVEELAAAERASRRRALPPVSLWLHRDSWAVAVTAVACIAWFVHMQSGGPLTRARLLDLGAITWDQVWVGEWWRLASAIFVHFDGAHLVANMITLLLVGPPLARLLGPWRFLSIFLLTGVAGNLASYVLAPCVFRPSRTAVPGRSRTPIPGDVGQSERSDAGLSLTWSASSRRSSSTGSSGWTHRRA